MKQDKNKIGLREKAAFACANVGNVPIMALISGYLLIFYTDVCGMNPFAVGTLFLITKLLDGVNDPIMGFVVDHLKPGRLGRFRPCLIFGTIICGLNYILLWLGPAYAPDGLKLLIAYISYILIGITFDLMDIPLNSMIPVMSDDMKERNLLSLIKGAAYMGGTVLFTIIPPLVITASGDQRFSYTILILVTVAMVVCLSVIGALGIQERVKPISEKSYKVKDLLRMLSLSPVLLLFISSLTFGIGSGMLNASSTYFATYIMGDLKLNAAASAMMIVGMLPALIAAPLLANKLGKKVVYGGGLTIAGAANLIRFLNVTYIPLWYLAYLLGGLGSGIMISVMYGIQADNVDFAEVKTGIRAEGAIASLSSFVSKAASGIGAALPAYVLGWTGFVANQAQTPGAERGILLCSIGLPGLCTLFAGLLFLCAYPLGKKRMEQVETELRMRREKAEKIAP